MRSRSPIVVSLVILACLALLTACTGATAPAAETPSTGSTAGAVTETEVISYQPGAPSGDPQSGNCWTSSLVLPRADAWRCMVGNQIYDPCFAETGVESVVCGADPATDSTGFLLTLTSPLPTPEASGAPASQAWLVELADGTLCGFATGATTGVGEKRLNYLCAVDNPDPSAAVGLLGDLVPGQVWTAELATIVVGENGPALQSSEMVELRTVWQ